MAVAIVTDSNAGLAEAVLARADVEVVPMVVTVDGVDFHEGLDLDAGWCYERLAAGAEVLTASPSPGNFLVAYQAAADRGAAAVVSIHIGSNLSSTASSANVAARMSPVPVTIVDTGLASHAVGWCVAAALDAVDAGGDAVAVADASRRTASAIGTIFVVGALSLATRGGRLSSEAVAAGGVPVLRLAPDGMQAIDHADDQAGAIEAMARHLVDLAAEEPLDVAVGDAAAPAAGDALVDRLGAVSRLVVVDRFELVPSLGAHLGVGTVGAVYRRSARLTW